MTEPLFSIGSYASATGLTASALRFYADAGLLVPDHVEERTGYRYYSSASVDRARLVSRLRSAGTPIEVLRLVIDSEPAAAADRLEQLADERHADGVRAGEVLRAVAAELRRPAPTDPVVTVDSLELAAALEAAGRFAASEAPFDRVSLVIGEHAALDVVATDRFRLSSHRLAAAEGRHGSGRASLGLAHVDDAVRWLRAGPRDVDLTVRATTVELGDGDRRLDLVRRGDHLPDHVALITPPTTELTRVELGRDLVLDALGTGADTVVVEPGSSEVHLGDRVVGRTHRTHRTPGGSPVTLTGSLLAASLAVLTHDTVIMEWDDPHRPVHLTSALVPQWRTLIMPARVD